MPHHRLAILPVLGVLLTLLAAALLRSLQQPRWADRAEVLLGPAVASSGLLDVRDGAVRHQLAVLAGLLLLGRALLNLFIHEDDEDYGDNQRGVRAHARLGNEDGGRVVE